MKRIMLASIAVAAAATLAGCVPSTYGYGNYGGYGSSRTTYPYGSSYPTYPYGQSGYGNSPYGQSGYGTSRPTLSSDGTFRCESNDGRTQRCMIDTRGGVSLVRQDSDAPCIQGRTWGYDRDGVWVSSGCRARFALGGYGYSSGYSNYGRDAQTVRCESQDGRRDVCGLPFRATSVAISRQLSDTRCSQGYNWGWSGDTVWVDRGCRAEFVARY
jgi:hypothetical protein